MKEDSEKKVDVEQSPEFEPLVMKQIKEDIIGNVASSPSRHPRVTLTHTVMEPH